jgi:hypothetical protein
MNIAPGDRFEFNRLAEVEVVRIIGAGRNATIVWRAVGDDKERRCPLWFFQKHAIAAKESMT